MKKRTTPNQDLFFAILFMAVCTAALVMSLQYGQRARMVPLAVATASIIFVLLDLFFERVLHRKVGVDAEKLFTKAEAKGACATVEEEGTCEVDIVLKEQEQPEWLALTIVTVLLALVWLLGIIPGLVAFVFGFFKFVNKDRLFKSAAWATGLTFSVWVVFSLALKVEFYHGVIGSFL